MTQRKCLWVGQTLPMYFFLQNNGDRTQQRMKLRSCSRIFLEKFLSIKSPANALYMQGDSPLFFFFIGLNFSAVCLAFLQCFKQEDLVNNSFGPFDFVRLMWPMTVWQCLYNSNQNLFAILVQTERVELSLRLWELLAERIAFTQNDPQTSNQCPQYTYSEQG